MSYTTFKKGEEKAFEETRILNRLIVWAVLLQNQVTEFGSLLPTADKELDKQKEFFSEIGDFITAHDKRLLEYVMEQLPKDISIPEELKYAVIYGHGYNSANDTTRYILTQMINEADK